MNIDIKFEINDIEAAELISELQYIVAQSGSPHLNKLLNEIIKDTNVSKEIANHFFRWVKSYTSYPVNLESKFKFDLRFADWWLASDDGLAQLCNLTLKDIKKSFGGTYEVVKGKDLSKTETVKEVIEVILSKYSLL